MLKKGFYRDEAIVLNSHDFGESDRIIVLYTPAHGKIRAVAKGARRSRKRFVGKLDAPSLLRIMFSSSGRGELQRLEEAVLVDGFAPLKSNIEILSHACYFLELASETTKEGIVQESAFELLLKFLNLLSQGMDLEALSRFFEIRLLANIGLMPELACCVVCRDDGAGRKKFSSEKGGVVCLKCSESLSGLMSISSGTAGLLSMAARMDADKLTRLKATSEFIKESKDMLYNFIRHHTGKELKTRVFMDKLKAMSLITTAF